jgi:hypothetical protein
MKLEYYQQFFEKYSKTNFVNIRPVEGEMFHADRRREVTKLILALRGFANAPRNVFLLDAQIQDGRLTTVKNAT